MAMDSTADTSDTAIPAPDITSGLDDLKIKKPPASTPKDAHPSGKESYGRVMQVVRGLALLAYFFTCCIAIFITQLIGAPLYWVNHEWFYAYMAMTKRSFAIVTTTMTHIWGPTVIRVSGDESVSGQIKPSSNGGIELDFPERMIMIANHQIYTDWLYLWWIGYGNTPRMDGHIYIILKESLKHIPLLGWGMMFYGFIFMSRKMATDRPRLAYRLNKLKQPKTDPSGKQYLDPMWLLLFPEGTNLSGNGRRKSKAWAEKTGLRDPAHVLLPRSTGIYFCLKELQGTVDYIYDCTIAYEGIGRGEYGEEIFTLSSTYFQGRPPKTVNFYWRRFRLDDVPLGNTEEFDLWLRDQWYKKDALMEEFLAKGRFPPLTGGPTGYVASDVRTRQPWELVQVFTMVGILGLVWNNVVKVWRTFGSYFG